MVHIVPVPVNADNYAYLLVTDAVKGECAAVDPAEADKVLKAAEERGWKVTSILTTHHHHDHAGGNNDMLRLLGSIPVYGGDDRIDGLTHTVTDGTTFTLGTITIKPLYTICHTTGSVSYYVTDETNDKAVFTGDTLFVGGCGRFFEGTPLQMHTSLNLILGPSQTPPKFTAATNTRPRTFVLLRTLNLTMRPSREKLLWTAENAVTVPSTIGEEKLWNPFMRVHVGRVVEVTGGKDAVEVMGRLREMKNQF
ncbi:beta-lactamase-like protein [Chytridium lagenaria]|nr:beta-lactamase-like protein [Chytridium lagenaria]